jgi:hypothetical protein
LKPDPWVPGLVPRVGHKSGQRFAFFGLFLGARIGFIFGCQNWTHFWVPYKN